MRILLVSLWHVEYALELAKAMARNNHVHLMLDLERVKQTIGEKAVDRLRYDLSFSLLSLKSLRYLSTAITIFKMVATVFRFKPDVIHIQECYNPINVIFLFLRKFQIVTTVHDIVTHPGEDMKTLPKWRLFLIKLSRKYGYQKIIVHGNALRSYYTQLYKNTADNIFVIPHGCLFSFLKSEQNPAVEEPHTVLFFGRIQEYKGLRYLIEAETLVSEVIIDFKIIVAGKGEDLDKFKSRLVSNPHYEIHDYFIPNESVATFFRRASAVVLPYTEASQSGIVAIAFAFGKPVISTNVGSLGEMVVDGYSGIVVPPKDSAALALAIIELLKDSSERKRLARNAQLTSHTELGWESIARLTIEAYHKKEYREE